MRPRKSSVKPVPAKSVKNSHPSPSILLVPIPATRKEAVSAGDGLSEVQIDFAELENGSLVDVVEGPADPNRTLLAIFKCGRIRLAGRVEDRGRIGNHRGRRTPFGGCCGRESALLREP